MSHYYELQSRLKDVSCMVSKKRKDKRICTPHEEIIFFTSTIFNGGSLEFMTRNSSNITLQDVFFCFVTASTFTVFKDRLFSFYHI